MNTSDILAAAEQLVGFVIVIMALSILWGLTALMGRVVSALAPAKPAAKKPATQKAVAAQSSTEGDDELVVIAATAAMLLGERHRIVSVKPAPSTWGQQGRRDIHASHRIR
ncbi:MAG: hypothetical protein D6781_08820 [Verrucomicrobia bacterium]|nr:MAG: hypothetical protein D6781_08820 [Verrucomicrobiota bacterium]